MHLPDEVFTNKRKRQHDLINQKTNLNSLRSSMTNALTIYILNQIFALYLS